MTSATIILLGAFATAALAQDAFIDHGVGAPASESRGVVVCEDANGKSLVIALSLDSLPKGWILVTDIDTEETKQYYYPEGVPNSPPYASLLSRNGRFYTFAGKTAVEFDPTTREWGFHGVPAPGESCYCGSAMADGPDGLIYGGSYPHCHLVSFDPKSGEMKDHGAMDPAEHYVQTLAFDSAGWVYCGIGTARCNIVAFNPVTGERRQIVQEDDRKLGSGHTHLGKDGKAYGTAGGKFYRLFGGNGEEIEKEEYLPAVRTGAIGWGAKSGTFPDGRRLVRYDLPGRWMDILDPESGEKKRITFDYESGGAAITSLTLGPDGVIYGSSCHPMYFFGYKPEEDKLETFGPIPLVGGGNFCAMAAQGGYVFGAEYAGGRLFRYDPTKPWNGATGDDPNPKVIAQYKADICRPRACIAHPDGRHVLMAGFAGYGMRGGGIAIHDLETEETILLKHTDVIPEQSTITMRALPNGDIVGGTSISTPGGGHPTAKEGVLYIMDWETRKVSFQTVPVPGAADVFSIEVGPSGLVYGLASGSRFFVFDPEKKEVIHREDMSAYGGLPRQVLQMGPDGKLYAAFTASVVRIDPKTFEHEKLASPPKGVSAGLAIHNGRLYFAARSHLWSYGLLPGD